MYAERKMKRPLLVLVVLLLCVAAPQAVTLQGTIRPDHIGCLTKDALDELVSAASKRDYAQMHALVGSVCFSIGGLKFSTVDVGFVRSKVRVYAGGGSIVLWVVTEAIH